MYYIKSQKKGFTLVEITLVLTITVIIGFLAFSKMLKQQERNKAEYAGDQIKQIGNSANAYISNHYDTLSTLSNATGSSSDIGPRTCSSSTNTCTITISTLVNEGLLPSTYSGTNVYGQNYNILLKRAGTAPYYKISGLLTTSTSLNVGGNIRYDLLGQAMQKAGIDSGMSLNSSNKISGFNGSWSASTSDYSTIDRLGLLGYQLGYGTYNYSVFLRRDGTLPMTGSLDMGSNSINNAVDYTGSGNINTGGTITAGSEITAKNGYGDSVVLGGDSSGTDYELRLGSAKPLTVYSPNSTQYTTVLSVNRNTVIGERLSTNGMNPNDLPTGWTGGVRTYDIYAGGTIAAGNNGNIGSYMNTGGKIYASTQIITDGKIATNGLDPDNIPNGAAGGIRTWDVFSGGAVGILPSGLTNVKGVSMNVTDFAFYANNTGVLYSKNGITSGNTIVASGNITGNAITANGRLTATEYLKLSKTVTLDTSCPDNGLIARDTSGAIVACNSGTWQYPATFKTFSVGAASVDAACVASGDTNPPGYTYVKWAIVCGKRFCTANGYKMGLVVEAAGVPDTKPYGSGAASIQVSCSK